MRLLTSERAVYACEVCTTMQTRVVALPMLPADAPFDLYICAACLQRAVALCDQKERDSMREGDAPCVSC